MMKQTIFTLLLLLSSTLTYAQMGDNEVIFKAMTDELERNKKELVLPDNQPPFVISYTLVYEQEKLITSSMGAVIMQSAPAPSLSTLVEVWVGDYHRNSESVYEYSPSFVDYIASGKCSYDGIRISLWNMTDRAYKQALQMWDQKKQYLRNSPLTAKEDSIADWQKIEPVTKVIESKGQLMFDEKLWEEQIKQLSVLFKEYPELTDTWVRISFLDREIYKLTSEGVKIKQPMRYCQFSAGATVLAQDGEQFSDSYRLILTSPDELPNMETLTANIRQMADNLTAWRTAPSISEYYIGPVLFENGAVEGLVYDNLLKKGNGLLSGSKYSKWDTDLSTRINKKIIDENLTLKNYSTLENYKGTNLLGAYAIDAEGVIPADEITLVDCGILKRQLATRQLTLRSSESTGSARFYPMGSYQAKSGVGLGTVHLIAQKSIPQVALTKQLFKEAKKQDLDYVYITRRGENRSAQYYYQVDVKTGEEKLVRTTDLVAVNLLKLRRILGASKQETVRNMNVNTSIIHPTALLIDDIEINISNRPKEKQPALTYPLKRDRVQNK